jgi:hypothetical protein
MSKPTCSLTSSSMLTEDYTHTGSIFAASAVPGPLGTFLNRQGQSEVLVVDEDGGLVIFRVSRCAPHSRVAKRLKDLTTKTVVSFARHFKTCDYVGPSADTNAAELEPRDINEHSRRPHLSQGHLSLPITQSPSRPYWGTSYSYSERNILCLIPQLLMPFLNSSSRPTV